jgi:HAD superfamily hydrolase (TIGR01490 family)
MILAVFDVDETLVGCDSLKWFGWYICKRGGLSLNHVSGFILSTLKYLLGRTTDQSLKIALLRLLLDGKSVDNAKTVADDFVREVLLDKMFGAARERIDWHRQRDHRIVFLSASPNLYLEPFARALSVDFVICTDLDCRNGVVTGELIGQNCKGEEKPIRLLSAPFLNEADWQNSFGYGNASEDIPFLSALGNPTAINPDRRLRAVAERNGWKVEHWR